MKPQPKSPVNIPSTAAGPAGPYRSVGFGRIAVTDLRDHKFLLTRSIAAAQKGIVLPKGAAPATWKNSGSTSWDVTEPGLPTNQGDTPQCGEYSCRNLLGASPVRNRIASLPPEHEIYRRAQSHDVQDYGWTTPFDGTTTRSVMKVGQDLGYWEEYRWSFNFDAPIREFVLNVGPILAGTIWPDSMCAPFQFQKEWWIDFDLDKDPAMFGPNAEGHLWCIFGLSTTKKCPDGTLGAARMIQSWGLPWGDDHPAGTVYVPLSKIDILAKEGGEFAAPLEHKHVTPKP